MNENPKKACEGNSKIYSAIENEYELEPTSSQKSINPKQDTNTSISSSLSVADFPSQLGVQTRSMLKKQKSMQSTAKSNSPQGLSKINNKLLKTS